MMIEVVPARSVTLNNLEWVYDTPHTLACRPKTLHEGGTFHARRSHKKSRSGCCNCRRRRVKCDERKPGCDKCAQQRITCNYPKTASPSDVVSETSTDSPWSSAVTSSMSLDLVEAQLRRAVMPEHCDKPTFSVSARAAGGSLIEVMDHFHHVASGTIGTPGMQEMMKSRVFQLAQDSAILINAVVAFSATHLRTLRPGDKKLQSISQHHNKISLQLYRHEMKNGVAFEKVDAMVATCFLVSAMAFFTEDSSPSASFVFSDDPRASEWIAVVSGFATILWKGRTPVLAQSMWLPVFAANHGFPFSELSPGKAGLPEQFVEICHIDDDSNALNNAYHDELRLLTNMMAIDAKDGTFSKLIQFPCRMNPAFSTLVREKDPVALLILAHWLAKISEVDFWWLGARVRRECFAICSYLDGWPDERFQPLLQYPMKVCGYLPIDLDLIQTYVFGM